MRTWQFWLLVGCSSLVSLLFLLLIYLDHAISVQQHRLVESQQIASAGPSYQNAWKQMGLRIYEMSRQDPELAAVLQRQQIAVHINKPASTTGTVPVSAPVEAPPAPSLPSPSKPPITPKPLP